MQTEKYSQAASESNAGGSHDNDDIEWWVKSLEFLSAGYDSLSAFRKEAREQLQGVKTKFICLME